LDATLKEADYQKGLEAYEKQDYATALRELKPLAELGNDEAQNFVGWMYEEGKGVPRNYQTKPLALRKVFF